MLYKAHFDGANKTDSRRYRSATLACVAGRHSILRAFDRSWAAILKKYAAPFLHTTDLLSSRRKDPYTDKEWESKRDPFLSDCVSLIEKNISRTDMGGRFVPGLVLCTIKIELKDFNRVRVKIQHGPQDASEILTMQCVTKSIEGGQLLKADFFEFIFDRGEPYYGHLSNRIRNPRFKRGMVLNGIDVSRRFACSEADMRNVPSLQAADLIAWSVSHEHAIRYEWQRKLLSIPRESEHLNYTAMLFPDPVTSAFVKHLRLPRRKPTQ